MKRLVVSLLLLAAISVSLSPLGLADSCEREPSYRLEQFPYPSEVPGVFNGDYVAVSNSARLVAGYTDPDFDTVGIIMVGDHAEVFRVGTPFESYTWYWGINDKLTTVGFTAGFDGSFGSWMRTKKGLVRTFSDPDGEVYLYRLNNHDVAVGEIVYGSFWRPVIADRHGMKVVDPPGVDPDAATYFAAINDAGTIVGGTNDPVTLEHTCLIWKRGKATAVTHEGASRISPRAINNRGQVAGLWIESEIDPIIGDYRRHGFIREAHGKFRTVDVDYAWPESIDFGDGSSLMYYVDQTTEILDLNDRGEIVVQTTGWYDWDGWILPVWTYAIGTPVR